jgi:UDP-N-acetylmuramate: L-alanyl-gamma-D-glutamyl-meso-diaminopimelate ligase
MASLHGKTLFITGASRGNPAVEHVLNEQLAYTSGAEWLRDNVLPGRRTLAVAGTHG